MKIIDEREEEKNNDRKKKRVEKATVKVWELNDFVVRLS